MVQRKGLQTMNRQNGSGMPAITVGTDFRGNISSAVARPPLAGMGEGSSLGCWRLHPQLLCLVSSSSRQMLGLGGIWIFMAKTPF